MAGRRLLVLAAIFALASRDSYPAIAANFWLSASNPIVGGQLTSGSTPPATAAGIPHINRPVNDSGGSLFLWARPDAGKTLESWSLRVVSSSASVVRLTTSSVAPFNP